MDEMDRSRVNILGVGVSATNMARSVERIYSAIDREEIGYVCVTNVHVIMEAQKDPALKRILNNALLVTPDGMPTVWIGRLRGFSRMERVYGPDLMLEVCSTSVAEGYTHFLYGGHEGVAGQLADNLRKMFPGIRIVGTFTPPFRSLTPVEEADLVATVDRLKPDLFWVGLGAPKQEKFMGEHVNRLRTKMMIGVGAAFDIHTGRIKDAPSWVKKAGLQWLHRLGQERRRLARRYLIYNPLFILKILLQFLRLKEYSLIQIGGSQSERS